MMNLIYKIFLAYVLVPYIFLLSLQGFILQGFIKVLSLTINDAIANIVHAKIYSNLVPYMS